MKYCCCYLQYFYATSLSFFQIVKRTYDDNAIKSFHQKKKEELQHLYNKETRSSYRNKLQETINQFESLSAKALKEAETIRAAQRDAERKRSQKSSDWGCLIS